MTGASLPFGRRPERAGDRSGPDPAPWTVSALVARVKAALLDGLPEDVTVVGQVSNFKRHGSGHLYFSLKDEGATIDAVMFHADAASVRFEVADGLEVVAEGRVDVYERQGRLQLYVRRLTPKGTGALELAFRQLKERLEREGLFDRARKRALVRFPRGIGVVTSPTGAAIRDIARTLARRWPAARVYLAGVRVQGQTAAGEIAEAIGMLDAAAGRLGIDTLIVARGGGSLEDLWAFNEEVVARAVFAARTPIVAGIGHEVDFTIADFVADVRAATPTAAAELATPDGAELRRHVGVLHQRLRRRSREVLAAARSALAAVQRSAVFRDPTGQVRSVRQGLDELTTRMREALAACRDLCQRRLNRARQALAAHPPRRAHERAAGRLAQVRRDLAWALGHRSKLAGKALARRQERLSAAHPRHRVRLARQRVTALGRQLEAMSYRAALRRGYTVTRIEGGGILRSARDAGAGDVLETELIDGKVVSRVGGAGPARRGRKTKTTGQTPSLFAETEEKPWAKQE